MLARPSDDAAFLKSTGAKGVIKFEVPADRVRALEETLDARFSTRLTSMFFSKVHQLYFVKDAEHYGVAHNCNHFTAENIERLGCRIEGWVLLSKFEVGEPEGPVPPHLAPSTRPTKGPATARATTTPAAPLTVH